MSVVQYNTRNVIGMKKAIAQETYQATKTDLFFQVRRDLRIQDEINFINRYKWYNLPDSLNSQMLERMMYYKGQLMLFYMQSSDQFFILPFTQKGSPDMYGRFQELQPLQYNGSNEAKDKKDKKITLAFGDISRQVEHEIPFNTNEQKMTNACVVLKDYTPQIGESIEARYVLQDPIIEYEAEIICMHRTSLMNSTGVTAVRVGDESEASNVMALNDIVQNASLTGKKYVSTVGQLEFQDFTRTSAISAQDYMTALYSIDNLRLSFLGIENGGLAEKQGTILKAEAQSGAINTNTVLMDGLNNRQRFCNIANAIWGLGIWCEINQDVQIQETGLNNDETNDDSNIDDNNSIDGNVGGEE